MNNVEQFTVVFIDIMLAVKVAAVKNTSKMINK